MISPFTKGVLTSIYKQYLTSSEGMGQLRTLPHYSFRQLSKGKRHEKKQKKLGEIFEIQGGGIDFSKMSKL